MFRLCSFSGNKKSQVFNLFLYILKKTLDRIIVLETLKEKHILLII